MSEPAINGNAKSTAFDAANGREDAPGNTTPEPMQFAQVMADANDGLPRGPKPGTFDSKGVPGLSCPEALDMPPNRFDSLVDDFRNADSSQQIGHVPTVFWGSSTFANWTDLTHKFADLGAINRAMGGSTLPDLYYAARDTVLKHTPERVVLLGITNDLASGHRPERVFSDFVTLEHLIHGKQPAPQVPGADANIKLYVLGAVPAPCRGVLDEKYHLYSKVNALISDYASRTPNVFYVDTSAAVDDRPGHVDASQFGPDKLHPKPGVYDKLSRIIYRAIGEDEIPVP